MRKGQKRKRDHQAEGKQGAKKGALHKQHPLRPQIQIEQSSGRVGESVIKSRIVIISTKHDHFGARPDGCMALTRCRCATRSYNGPTIVCRIVATTSIHPRCSVISCPDNHLAAAPYGGVRCAWTW